MFYFSFVITVRIVIVVTIVSRRGRCEGLFTPRLGLLVRRTRGAAEKAAPACRATRRQTPGAVRSVGPIARVIDNAQQLRPDSEVRGP